MSTPSALYRNAIDLNRYSNSVSKRIIRSYNDLLVDTCQRLAGLDAASAPAKAEKLTAILGQLKVGLTDWASDSTALSIEELEQLAGVQAGFVEEQLRQALPKPNRDLVKSVEISPRFAEAVASFDPTKGGIISLSDDLQAAVTGASEAVRVTIADGVTLTLPNGQVLKNSFESMAEREAAAFGYAVRNGFLTGEPTESITQRLIGRLQKGDSGSIAQLLQAGGQATVKANNQIRTVVRTSINQVANAASMKAYEANQDITTKYRYIATLDNRTSPICRALDGTEHAYGKGPKPPQHFNCRSTTVPIIDYERLGFDPPPPSKIGRPNSNVPDGENYGPWLKKQPKAVKEEVLGDKGQVAYFDALSKKYGADGAIRRFVREDGSEKTIEDLKKAYGPASSIKAAPKAKAKPKPAPKPAPAPAPAPKPAKKKAPAQPKETPKPKAAPKSKATPKPKATIAKKKAELAASIAKAEELAAPTTKLVPLEDFEPQVEAVKPSAAEKKSLQGWSQRGYQGIRAEQFRRAEANGIELTRYEKQQTRLYSPSSKIDKDITEIERYLAKSPKYKGVVHRGVNMSTEDLNAMLEALQEGKSAQALESWSKDSSVADEFAIGGQNQVVFSVANKKGVDISGVSKFSNENEVLQPTNVRYRVKSVEKDSISPGLAKKGIFRYEVELEQLD